MLAWEHHRYTRRWWNIISSYRTERFHQWTEWFIIMKYFIQLIMETRYLSDQVSKAPKMLHPRFFLLQSWLGFGNNLCLKWGHRWESQSIIQNTPSTSLDEGSHQTRKDKKCKEISIPYLRSPASSEWKKWQFWKKFHFWMKDWIISDDFYDEWKITLVLTPRSLFEMEISILLGWCLMASPSWQVRSQVAGGWLVRFDNCNVISQPARPCPAAPANKETLLVQYYYYHIMDPLHWTDCRLTGPLLVMILKSITGLHCSDCVTTPDNQPCDNWGHRALR